MRIFLYITCALIILLGVTFAYLNATPVVLDYYVGEINLPLSLLLICALGIGIILGYIAMVFAWLRAKRRIRKLAKQLKNMQK